MVTVTARTQWRLGELMDLHGVTGSALARQLDVSEVAVSNLRTAETMPRINGERLDQIADALTELSGVAVTYRDLLGCGHA